VLAPPPEPPPPVGKTLRVLLVADGCREHPLPGAQKEAENLLQLFERVTNNPTGNRVEVTALVGPAQATPLDVLLHLSENPPFDMVHYAGHCFFNQQHPEKSGFLFTGGNVLTANDLERIDRTPKFIFANACESGVLPSRPDLSSPQLPAAFAEAFFKKGVANYIWTAWPVGDDAALQFSLELYKYLLGDGTAPLEIYQAMKLARQKIVASNTWGAYQHYGNPNFRLMRL
jgi:CHAT domain-containing protein